ncbi:MAG TPA: hypothetical protein PKH89_11340, partial [Anaerolineae bacterium]|nr:hypothetical protein [Anaerolineae bacterium]
PSTGARVLPSLARFFHTLAFCLWQDTVYDASQALSAFLCECWPEGGNAMKRPVSAVLCLAAMLLIHSVLVSADGVSPHWLQVNSSGFGDGGSSSVTSLAVHSGSLYAAAGNYTTGAQLWRCGPGLAWTPAVQNGFGTAHNGVIDHLQAFGGSLYASTENETDGGEVWRSPDGVVWTRVASGGFGDRSNAEVIRMTTFGGKLYAATWSYSSDHGTEIWRSDTGNAGSWTRVVQNGFGDAYNSSVTTFETFKGMLYAGTQNGIWTGSTQLTRGAEVWRSSTGNAGTWSRVAAGGFGALENTGVVSLAAFGDYLYASTGRSAGGLEVWRCSTCAGFDWTRVVTNGLGKPASRGMSNLEVYSGQLYLVLGNAESGMEVWRTSNGTTWQQVGFGGFGDSRNRASYWDAAVTEFDRRLFVGTWNLGTGGQVWMYLPHQLVLPVVRKVG